MGTMRYKPSDKVRIKSLDWYNKNKDDNHEIKFENGIFTPLKSIFLGQIMTIESITLEKQYIFMEDKYKTLWTDEMIEGLVEESLENDMKEHQRICDEIMAIQGIEPIEAEDEHIVHCPEGYQFVDENGNVINATKIVLEKKKKEYPKTYEECCKILGHLNVDLCFNADYSSFDASKEQWKRLGLMNQFYQLLICRDAYWKIAGEEMGLGEPWEPSGNEYCFVISRSCGEVYLYSSAGDGEPFEFPTKEMRDAFMKNFDPDIEFCKELL